MRRAVSLLASLALAATALTVTAPAAAASGGLCAIANQTNSHIYVVKHTNNIPGASYFDDVYGYSTIRDLVPCVGLPGGGTHVVAATVEREDGPGIYQLAWGEDATGGDGEPYFYYVLNNGGAAVRINSPRPNIPDTYKFRIYRRASGHVSFEIYNVTAGQFVWTYYPTSAWGTDTKLAWWGFETQESESQHGRAPGLAHAKIWNMSYSWEDTTNYTMRTNLVCDGTQALENGLWKSFNWDGSGYDPCAGTRVGQVLTTNYTGDTLRAYTTD